MELNGERVDIIEDEDGLSALMDDILLAILGRVDITTAARLQHLTLSNCDGGMPSVWKIDAPDSKLRVLELEFCWLRRLEVVCLPKLEQLRWDSWLCPYSPVKFDVAPSLKEFYLTNVKAEGQKGFMLSQVLSGTRSIQTTKLDFQGESIWIQPEGKQLCAAFNNLRKLSLHGIFVEFDLLWTIVFLKAVPRLEIFDIEVWEHPCQIEEETMYPMERVNPSWKLSELTSSCNSCLKELQIIGFKPLEQQLTFIKAVMKRAPNLGTVVLKYDDPCKDCEAIGIFPPRPSKECIFPMNEDKQDMVVKLIRDGVSSPAQIIFCT